VVLEHTFLNFVVVGVYYRDLVLAFIIDFGHLENVSFISNQFFLLVIDFDLMAFKEFM